MLTWFKSAPPANIVLLLLLVPLLLLLTFMFNPFTKSVQYEIVETRAFSCPPMGGFTFKYPVFKDWETITLKQSMTREIMEGGNDLFLKDPNHCIMTIAWSGFAEIPPLSPRETTEPIKPLPLFVEIKRDSGVDPNTQGTSSKNPAGIEFYQSNHTVAFLVDDAVVTVSVLNVDPVDGFSSEQFLKTVIESFTMTNKPNKPMGSFDKNSFFVLLEKTFVSGKSSQSFVEKVLGVKLEPATKQNDPGAVMYESAPSSVYDYIDYVLFYAPTTETQPKPTTDIYGSRIHIGLNKELKDPKQLLISDILETYGPTYQFNTPATCIQIYDYS